MYISRFSYHFGHFVVGTTQKHYFFLRPPLGGRLILPFPYSLSQGNNKKKLYGVRAILGVRSRVFQEMLYGISTVFGSPQVNKRLHRLTKLYFWNISNV